MKRTSLVELCKEYSLSRRTIQGYEKKGLVKPTGKNERGYLYYDEEVIQRILFINYLRRIGFQSNDIKTFIDEPIDVIKEKIASQIPVLQNKVSNLNQLIRDSKKLVEKLNNSNYKELVYAITKEENK